MFTVVVNIRFKMGVDLHDTLHGLRKRRGTGTATLEANPEKQLVRLDQGNNFQVFLDVCKDYNSLNRGILLEILRGTGWGQTWPASSPTIGSGSGSSQRQGSSR